jgi:putative peptidoglycan lipid II flippase
MVTCLVPETLKPNPGKMKSLLRPIATVTLLTIGWQAIGLVTQVVITTTFGAGADMDAFIAASVAPNYIITWLLSSLGFVFVPVLVDYAATGKEKGAWQISSGVVTLCMLTLGVLALTGMIFARPLLRWMAPGLSTEPLNLSTRVAMITWPIIVAFGLTGILTAIYQARERYVWPAVVSVIGALANLGMVAVLLRPFGVLGIALALATSLVLQAVILLPIALGPGRFRFGFYFQHPGVRKILHLLWPLALSGLFIRCTPLIDCYLASSLGEGAISHLGYAFKLTNVCALLLSAGISPVIFSRLALGNTRGDMGEVRHTVSWGLRGGWLSTAPAIFIGWALAVPFITVLFRRGQFSLMDAKVVASIFQVYLIAVAGMSLTNITVRIMHALQHTRIIAIIGVFEAIAYALYTPLLVKMWGILGVAGGYGLYFALSLVWCLLFIRFKTGNVGGFTLFRSFIRVTLAAMIGGAVAWAIASSMPNPWLQLIFGGAGGLASYIGVLVLFRSDEGQVIWNMVTPYLKKIRPRDILV